MPTRSWIRGFERRFSERFSKVKTSVLGKDRAQKATAKVRDITFAKFEAMLKDLREKGLFTDEQLKPENFGDHICNADEVGGSMSGKRKKSIRQDAKSLPKSGKDVKVKRKIGEISK